MMNESDLYEKRELKTSKSITNKIANLLFTVSVIGLFLTGFVAFSFFGLMLYYLILIIILFLTLFTTFSKVSEWFEKGEVIQEFLGTTFQYLPYSIGIGLGFAVLALILFILNKNYIYRTSKIITTSILIVLYIVAILLRFVVFAGN